MISPFSLLAFGMAKKQAKERGWPQPLFGFDWLEKWNEEVRRMVEFGVRPDGRFDGDSYGDQQRSNGDGPVAHSCCMGSGQNDCGDCSGHRAVASSEGAPFAEGGIVAGPVRFHHGCVESPDTVTWRQEFHDGLWRLLVGA